eukprot:TRINITY_DN4955_c0_g1_i3.p1 TRINITY_DN4955_c0_g1~~TRINITY_DN4955_c0_g1_i3.p1  ORF type:complete len:523 (-),score=39.97 TRINITY_DN4955_c0_g1_i3:23-1591(-)
MAEEVREPLLSEVGPSTFTSTSEHRCIDFRRKIQACNKGLWEDDQEFLASVWSRRPFLGYSVPTLFAITAFADVSYDGATFKLTFVDLGAVVTSALLLLFLDKASKCVDLFICVQCMFFSAAMSYSSSTPYASTSSLASISFILIILGLRTRYLASATFLVFLLFDRSTGGMFVLATSLVGFYICGGVIQQAIFYKAYSLQRSQDALIQYASDGFCSVGSNHGHLTFACSRFQDVFKIRDFREQRLQDFINSTDQSRLDEMLRSAKQGRFDQCLVTCYVGDAAIAFDASFVAYQYNAYLDIVDVCLKIQGEVRQSDANSADRSGVAVPRTERSQHAFVDIDGRSYQEINLSSSAQQSDDSIYAVLWDIIDAAASDNIVRSFGARAVVMEAQQMQALIFAQETRRQQRAIARSLLARYDRMRVDVLRDNVGIDGLRPVVMNDRYSWHVLANLEEDRLVLRERIIQDVVSAYRVFHHTELFSRNPCMRGLSITCEMLGFVGPLPHHKRRVAPAMMTMVRNFEGD